MQCSRLVDCRGSKDEEAKKEASESEAAGGGEVTWQYWQVLSQYALALFADREVIDVHRFYIEEAGTAGSECVPRLVGSYGLFRGQPRSRS